jgi:hypothetical protein
MQAQWRYAFLARGRARPFGHGGNMSLQSRIESLKTRHASLEVRITDEDHRPRPDTDALAKLKLEKLRLKEEMDRLRTAAPN